MSNIRRFKCRAKKDWKTRPATRCNRFAFSFHRRERAQTSGSRQEIMRLHMSTLRLLLLEGLLMIAACRPNRSPNAVEPLPAKPDLVIDTVSYTQLPTCYEGYPSGIICGPPTFMIGNSKSKEDFDNQYLSYGQIANYPPVCIPADGILNINIISEVEDSVSNILIVVNPDGSHDIRNVSSLVDEQDYLNNLYVVSLKW
jgi:hypothetical protein